MRYCDKCQEYIVPTEEEQCPRCGTENLQKAYDCKLCGEPTLEDYCEDCMAVAKRSVEDLAEYLGANTETAEELILAVVERRRNAKTL